MWAGPAVNARGSGIGLAAVERLCAERDAHVIMACRNKKKGEDMRELVLRQVPGADIAVMVVDVSSPASVYAFCDAFKARYQRLDVLFCNAGVMPIKGLRFHRLFSTVLRRGVDYVLMTGGEDFLVQQQRLRTPDGLGEVFATNIFGHYLMVAELNEQLAGGRIVWTSSTSANKDCFTWDDPQHVDGCARGRQEKAVPELTPRPAHQPISLPVVQICRGAACARSQQAADGQAKHALGVGRARLCRLSARGQFPAAHPLLRGRLSVHAIAAHRPECHRKQL